MLKIATRIIFSLAVLGTAACQTELAVKPADNASQIEVSTVKVNNRNVITLQINTNGFRAASYADAQAPSVVGDVLSYKVTLSTDPTDPFAYVPGTTVTHKDKTGSFWSVNYYDVPEGGPYYAFAAAFDDTVANGGGLNITEPDPSLTSVDKMWSISDNNVTVGAGDPGGLTFSPSGTYLTLNVQLRHGGAAQIDTSIDILNGSGPVTPAIEAL